jgi:hypothetical protein
MKKIIRVLFLLVPIYCIGLKLNAADKAQDIYTQPIGDFSVQELRDQHQLRDLVSSGSTKNLVKFLDEHKKIDLQYLGPGTHDSRSLIELAVAQGQFQNAKLLIERGFNINAINPFTNMSPLQRAAVNCEYSDVLALKLLGAGDIDYAKNSKSPTDTLDSLSRRHIEGERYQFQAKDCDLTLRALTEKKPENVVWSNYVNPFNKNEEKFDLNASKSVDALKSFYKNGSQKTPGIRSGDSSHK